MTELRLKNKYETDLYWIHQMFLERWDCGRPHIMAEEPDSMSGEMRIAEVSDGEGKLVEEEAVSSERNA